MSVERDIDAVDVLLSLVAPLTVGACHVIGDHGSREAVAEAEAMNTRVQALGQNATAGERAAFFADYMTMVANWIRRYGVAS